MNGIGMKSKRRRDWTDAHAKVEEEGGCRLAKDPVHRIHCAGPIDPAHVIDRSLGGGMEPASVVPLCRHHHSAFDAHELDLLGHLTRDEEVAAVQAVGLESARIRICPSDYSPFLVSARKADFAA